MRTRILTIVFSCCALAVGIAQSQTSAGRNPDPKAALGADSHESRPAPRPPFKWWAIDKYKQELRLTNEQSAEIEKVFQVSMERLRVDKDDMDRAQTSFSQLMEKPSAGEREFARAVDQLELARYNVSKERTLMLVHIHSILTPDQRKRLEAIRKRNEAERNSDKNGDKDRQH
jgi:Spy/CpxP family protein refolding chaperone